MGNDVEDAPIASDSFEFGHVGADSDAVKQWSSQGATIGWVGVNDRPVGVFGVADSVRPEAIEAVARLKVKKALAPFISQLWKERVEDRNAMEAVVVFSPNGLFSWVIW